MWGSIVGSFLGAAIATGLGIAWRSYFSEKGKNLATKQDIGQITNEIESAKSAHARDLEAVKHSLSAQMSRYGFRYQQEFEILKSLSAFLVDVRDSSMALRPVLDFQVPGETEEQRKERRLKDLHAHMFELYKCKEKLLPFYPPEIREAVDAVFKAAHFERVQYQYGDRQAPGMKYYEEAQKNQADIAAKASAALEAIRVRVISWESPPKV
ncbi:hypothetical protein [Achromobacter mucicolens]|uniref:hypothetical protein n=1 Tax=Achromobacter mucicolens TaxID=1389922 RepID=UPI001CBB4889|nr:hypothetical protein [Achromobacter mucicolens]UAN04424.1 hypothetical protein K9D24_09920 [Achromobacter mucicolens]